MSQAEVNRVLAEVSKLVDKRELFERWLDKKAPADVVGHSQYCQECPIAMWLHDASEATEDVMIVVLYRRIEVINRRDLSAPRPWVRAPAWVGRFEDLVDFGVPAGEPITAETCKKRLESAVKMKEPQHDSPA